VNYYRPVLAVVIVLNGLLYNIKTPQSMLVISAGMYKETRWRVTIQGAIILVTGILLGKSFGLAGILVGSCLSNLYRTIDLLHFTPKHITHAKRGKTMRRMVMVCINVLLITLPSFFVSLSVTGYFSWVLYAVCCGVYALGIVTATSFLFDKKECISLIRRFRTTLIKRG